MSLVILEPFVESSDFVHYAILDRACGTLVNKDDIKSGLFDYTTYAFPNYDSDSSEPEEHNVINSITIKDNEHVLFGSLYDVRVMKHNLQAKNPEGDYVIVSFEGKVYNFFEYKEIQ